MIESFTIKVIAIKSRQNYKIKSEDYKICTSRQMVRHEGIRNSVANKWKGLLCVMIEVFRVIYLKFKSFGV